MKTDASAAPARGVRDRLLDALESLIADRGIAALSHRSIARRADVHASLLHYHFGTVEQAVEEAVARRASRFVDAQLAALRALRVRIHWTVEDVVTALWRPFADVGGKADGAWHNYLCLVARIGDADHRVPARHFHEADREALHALRGAIPEAPEDTLASGLRLTRMLFHCEVLARCREGAGDPTGVDRDRRVTAFAAAGIRALVPRAPVPGRMPATI
ncbi:MAG TPA: TetR/AcrR family transcriptional regulator [Casimicrobiaceae bacterium]|nr:TetR/AcrR family transcriptional regulator [Casimicrobiaceae bacterium]